MFHHYKRSFTLPQLDKIKGSYELTVVVEDHVASTSHEVTVHKGQQVEIVERSATNPDWCFVRVLSGDPSGGHLEGLVPMFSLKPIPAGMKGSVSKNSMEAEESSGTSADASPSTSTYSLSNNNISPANKRRSTFRKWLSNPVRKISHGRLDKTVDTSKSGNKKASGVYQKWRTDELSQLPKDGAKTDVKKDHKKEKIEASKASLSTAAPQPAKSPSVELNGEEEEGCDIEIPPPMPIQAHNFVPCPPPPEDLQNKMEQQDLKNDSQTEDRRPNESPISLLEGATAASDYSISETGASSELSGDDSVQAQALKKRMFVLHELVDTERDYVKDLGGIPEGYMKLMKEIPIPADMEGKDKIIFGNIQQIYEWHRDVFLGELEKCLEDPDKLATAFIKYERRLHMYVVYCQNKPKSEYIVSEYVDTYFEELRQKLGHKLHLSDLLIKPVQRVMKYQLLLKDFLKYTEKAGLDSTLMKRAVNVMCVVPKAANDMMEVGRLQGFEGKLTSQGKLLLQDTLFVGEYKDNPSVTQFKGKERRVFLFEQIIILSESIGPKKEFSNPVYVYKNHIQVNKMALIEKTEDDDPSKFILKSKCPHTGEQSFILQASSQEAKAIWMQQLRTILDSQQNFLRALQSPIAYQKELTKELSAPEMSQLWTPSLRKTMSHPPPPMNANDTTDKERRNSSAASHSSSSGKHSRCKSVPGQLPPPEMRRMTVSVPSITTREGCVAAQTRMASLPCSPVDSKPPELPLSDLKNVDQQRKHSLPTEKRSSQNTQQSPKAKKNFFEGFKQTLRPKSKTDSNLGNVSSPDGSLSPQDAKKALDSDCSEETPSQIGLEGEDSEQQATEYTKMKVLSDYPAIKEDEISVAKGETVLLLATNQHNTCLVHRPANQSSPAAEGWIPTQVLGPVKEGDSGGRLAALPSLKSSTCPLLGK